MRTQSRNLPPWSMALGLGLILAWQLTFYIHRHSIPADYQTHEIVGLHDNVFRNFLYFFHYFGVFPVGSEMEERVYSQAGAEDFIKAHGRTLVMDLKSGAGKMGDYGKLFLYLPEVFLHGSPERASVKTSSFVLFLAGLLSLFASFWLNGMPVLGGLLVLFIGSDPFQVFQVYRNSNVFSVAISVALLLWAMNLRFFLPKLKMKPWYYLAPLASGVLVALARGVRVEAGLMVYSVAAIYLFTQGAKWKEKIALVLCLFVCQGLTTGIFDSCMDRLYTKAVVFTKTHGGIPYEGPRRHNHVVWHTLATGLGDFGQKYGYQWKDQTAYAMGMPEVTRRFFPNYSWKPGKFVLENSHDANGVYPIQPEDLVEYELVMREKILGDIFRDPVWYAGVLTKRFWRVLTDLTPVSLAVGHWRVGIPAHGLLVIGMLGWLFYRREWLLVKVILFPLPLSLGPLLHYSGGGLTYFAIYHLAAFSVALCLVLSTRRFKNPVLKPQLL